MEIGIEACQQAVESVGSWRVRGTRFKQRARLSVRKKGPTEDKATSICQLMRSEWMWGVINKENGWLD